MSEKRYVDPVTGGEKGQKEARLGGADPLAMMELAKVYGMGEEKYARYNYLQGYPWSLSVDALFRHLLAFLGGEEVDPESGLLHTAHVAWHALTLTSFQQRGVGTDDRAPRLTAKQSAMDRTAAVNIIGSKYKDIPLSLKRVPPQPKCEPWCCARPNATPHGGGCQWCPAHPPGGVVPTHA